MSAKVFRVGLVGAGYVSRFHISALKRLTNVRLAGITDLDPLLARKTGLPVYANLEEMADAGLDVVHVLTPPDAHAATALRALALGCHVLVEKPLATSLEDCDRLEAAARSRGLSLCVNHSLLGDPLMRRALALVRDGKIGELVAVDYRWSSEYPPYSGGPPPPHHLDGGHPFRDLGAHVLYVVREFLGDILDVQAFPGSSGLKESDPNLHFDEWSVFVRCAGGTGTARFSWNAKPLRHQVLILGTRGSLHLDLFSMFLTRRRATRLPKALERVANTLAESISSSAQIIVNAARFMAGNLRPYQGLHNFVGSFYEALTNGQPMPAGVGQARGHRALDGTNRPQGR